MADPVADHHQEDRLRGAALMRELLLRLPAAVAYIAGPDLIFEFANEQFRRYAGGREVVGRPLRDVPELPGQQRELAERAARAGQALTSGESEVWVRRPGREPEQVFADIVCQPVRDEAGKVGGVLLYGHDVTAHVLARHRLEARGQQRSAGRQAARAGAAEAAARRAKARVAFLERVRQRTGQLAQLERHRRELETELRQAERFQAMGQLTSGISHDFRNVLGIIVGYAEMAEDITEHDRDPELQRTLEEIRCTAERAVDLCGELLRFSQGTPPVLKKVDLNDVISCTKSLLTVSMGGRVEVDFEPCAVALPTVRADRTQMEQVLLNLAVNARDAMQRGGTLRIKTSAVDFDANRSRLHRGTRPGRYVELLVQDTGTGMAADVQAKIFERFFTTKRLGRGTGLGLCTVQGIIAEAGGTIEVDSLEGSGTTFRIYLPALPDDRPQLAGPGRPSSAGGGRF